MPLRHFSKLARSAAVRLDLTYELARNHHNPMEPHATIARWDGDTLTVRDKTQRVVGTRDELSTVFDLPKDSVRVINPFVGGAFGSGLRCWPHTIVAALAARVTGRPVKLVLSRRQMYFGTGFRPSYEYRLRLGSDRRGRLTARLGVDRECPVELLGGYLLGIGSDRCLGGVVHQDVQGPLPGVLLQAGLQAVEQLVDVTGHAQLCADREGAAAVLRRSGSSWTSGSSTPPPATNSPSRPPCRS
jgi:hypothetical protein